MIRIRLYKLLPIALPVATYIWALVSFLGASTYSRYDFPLDDAWVHRIYARSFSNALGFEYNDGSQEAGSTSPLWSIVSSPAHWLEGFGSKTVVFSVKLIGAVLGILTILIIFKIGKLIVGSRLGGMVAALLFAVEPRFLYSTLSGMENVLLIALWSIASYAFLRERWVLSFCFFSLTSVTRPEALIILPFCVVAYWFLEKREAFTKKLLLPIILVCPFLLWMIFCQSTTGHWFPNTFYMKAQSPHLGTKEWILAWLLLSQHGLSSLLVYFIGMAAFLFYLAQQRDRIGLISLLFLLIAPIMYLLGVVASRQMNLSGYYWTRWAEPAILMLAIPFCVGIALMVQYVVQRQNWKAEPNQSYWLRRRILYSVAACVGLLSFIVSVPDLSRSFIERRLRLATDSRAIHIMDVQTGRWINDNVPKNAKVGVNNTGAIRYFGKRHTMDFFGLNNSDITFQRKSFMDVVNESDWLAIYPRIFGNTDIFHLFEQRMSYTIPLKEYTVCNCPSQIHVVIYEKKQP